MGAVRNTCDIHDSIRKKSFSDFFPNHRPVLIISAHSKIRVIIFVKKR